MEFIVEVSSYVAMIAIPLGVLGGIVYLIDKVRR